MLDVTVVVGEDMSLADDTIPGYRRVIATEFWREPPCCLANDLDMPFHRASEHAIRIVILKCPVGHENRNRTGAICFGFSDRAAAGGDYASCQALPDELLRRGAFCHALNHRPFYCGQDCIGR